MVKLDSENLYLLEFLVEDLKLNNKCYAESPGETCVAFQFLDNKPIDLCEGDVDPNNKFLEKSCNKTGKSCLFSLTPEQAQKALNCFDICIQILKKMTVACKPQRFSIGGTRISILDIFVEVLCDSDSCSPDKTLRGTYQICDNSGALMGKMKVYIRLSCYGKNIVTQFQMNMDDKSVLFKDREGKSLYRYKKCKKGKTTQLEDAANRMQQDQSSCGQPPTGPPFGEYPMGGFGGPMQNAMPPCFSPPPNMMMGGGGFGGGFSDCQPPPNTGAVQQCCGGRN